MAKHKVGPAPVGAAVAEKQAAAVADREARAPQEQAGTLGTHAGEPLGPEVLVDPEFANLLPLLSEADFERLERQVLEDGQCRDPLTVWKGYGILLDGHTRLRICQKHGLRYTAVEVDLADRLAAKRWILQNQRSRRNLTPLALAYSRGKEYEVAKQQGERTDLAAGQSAQKSGPAAGGRVGDTTAKRLAGEWGVDEKTIRRGADFARALDIVAETTSDAFRVRVLGGQLKKLTRSQVVQLSRLRPSELKGLVPTIFEKGAWDDGTRAARPTAVQALQKSWAKLSPGERRVFLSGLLAEEEDAGVLLEVTRGLTPAKEYGGDADEKPATAEDEAAEPAGARDDDEPAPRRTPRP